MLSSTDSVVVLTIVSVPSTVKLPPTLRLFVTTVSFVAVIVHVPDEEMVRFVPFPSIFSPSSPNVIPTTDGMLKSAVAVRLNRNREV